MDRVNRSLARDAARGYPVPARAGDLRGYAAALKSPVVQERVRNASQMTQAYGVEGTPTFAVQGRYVVSPPPGDRRAILAITEQLIRRFSSAGAARARP